MREHAGRTGPYAGRRHSGILVPRSRPAARPFPPSGIGRGGETPSPRAFRPPSTAAGAPAQLLPAGRTAASRHQARFPAEHRILRAEDELIGPELRPDRGDQLSNSPEGPAGCAGPPAGRPGSRSHLRVLRRRSAIIRTAMRPRCGGPAACQVTPSRRRAAHGQLPAPAPPATRRTHPGLPGRRQAMTRPASTHPAGPTVQAMAGSSGCASRMAGQFRGRPAAATRHGRPA